MRPTTWGVLGSIVALAWLGGGALPMERGWLLPLLAIMAVAVVTAARLGTAPLGGWLLSMRPRSNVVRSAVVGATGFAAVVFATVLGGGIGELLIAFPGATAAVAVVALASLVFDRIGRVGAWLLPPVLIGLAVVGARFEEEGADAQGAAWSGPILGIHPFQTTAVVIDGFGPFDVPINDFVEPAGGRGYDPDAYAATLERALHRIAEVHFADGPARARQAFAGATVTLVRTPPVRERLDSPPVAIEPGGLPPQDARVVVRSGTTGQRSRVEFVCPGRREDPRGPRPEAVMGRTCPTKYASEASAGLGVTGRWPGYAELRGNERVGLSRLLGITRGDAPEDVHWRGRERWMYATIVLLVVLASTLARGGAAARATVAAAGPLTLPLVLLVVAAAWIGADPGVLAARAEAPPWAPGSSLTAWQGLLAFPAGAAFVAWAVPEADHRPVPVRLSAVFAGLLVLWWAATDLEASRWLSPQWWQKDAPLEAAAIALADALAPALVAVGPHDVGMSTGSLDAIVAVALAAPMVVACVVVVRAVGVAGVAAGARPTHGALLVVATVGLAVALGVSRKTAGGVALLPAAVGVALVLGSTLRMITSRGPWPRVRISVIATAAHLAWVAIGLAMVAQTLPTGRQPVLWAYFVIASVAAALPIAACFADPRPRGGPPNGSA